MTKDEAHKKWCPMVRVASTIAPLDENGIVPSIINRDPPGYNCLADGCACWVWRLKKDLNDPSTWEGQCGLIR